SRMRFGLSRPRLYVHKVSIYSRRSPSSGSQVSMRKIFCVCLAALALSGCASREPLQSTPRLTVVEGASASPAPVRSDLTAPDRPALIGPLDTIEVDVFGVRE